MQFMKTSNKNKEDLIEISESNWKLTEKELKSIVGFENFDLDELKKIIEYIAQLSFIVYK